MPTATNINFAQNTIIAAIACASAMNSRSPDTRLIEEAHPDNAVQPAQPGKRNSRRDPEQSQAQ